MPQQPKRVIRERARGSGARVTLSAARRPVGREKWRCRFAAAADRADDGGRPAGREDPRGSTQLLADEPAALREEIVSINTDATSPALRVALLVPILTGLQGYSTRSLDAPSGQ